MQYIFQETKRRAWAKTPLMKAAKCGQFEMVKLLVELRADVNKEDECTNQTPLLMAVHSKNEPCIKYLIDKGSKINILSSDTCLPPSPLLMVISQLSAIEPSFYYHREDAEQQRMHETRTNTLIEKHMRIFDLLLQHGANTNLCLKSDPFCIARDDVALGKTPLMVVASMNFSQAPVLLDKLLQHGADVNQIEKSHNNYADALSCAIDAQHSDIVRLLIQSGADTNGTVYEEKWSVVRGYVLICLAWANKDFVTVKYLTQAGCALHPNFGYSIQNKYLAQTYYDGVHTKGIATERVNCRDNMQMNMESVQHDRNTQHHEETVTNDDFPEVYQKEYLNKIQLEALSWLYEFSQQPRTLKDLCRSYLRQKFDMFDPKKVSDVPLPTPLKEFVLCKYL